MDTGKAKNPFGEGVDQGEDPGIPRPSAEGIEERSDAPAGSESPERPRAADSKEISPLQVVWEPDHPCCQDFRDDLIYSVLGLVDGGFPVCVRNNPLTAPAADEYDGRISSQIEDLCGDPPNSGRHVSFQHAHPLYLERDENAITSIGRTGVGTVGIPQEWLRGLEAVDEVWVPSAFSRMALLEAGLPEDSVHIIPTCVDEEIFCRTEAASERDGDGGFVFMTVLDWDYSRGLDLVLEAFVREFRRSENVKLVLKSPEPRRSVSPAVEDDGGASFWSGLETWLSHRMNGSGDAEDEFEALLNAIRSDSLREELRLEREAERRAEWEIKNAVREEMKGRDGQIPEIKVISRSLPRSLMPRLYSACDAFVMAPRAETWGRPFLESMASGLPTIGTRWGGHLEFMRPDNSFLIRVRALVDLRGEDALQRDGQRLAEPDLEHLRELMRRVYEHRSEAQERGERGAAHIRSKYTRERVTSLMVKRLKDLVGGTQEDAGAAA